MFGFFFRNATAKAQATAANAKKATAGFSSGTDDDGNEVSNGEVAGVGRDAFGSGIA